MTETPNSDEKQSTTVPNRPLSGRQRRTIAAVLAARSVEEGLRAVSVAKSTYYKWVADPAFKAELDRQESALIETAVTSLKQLVIPAVITLKELLQNGADPVRLRAANMVLERAASVVMMEKMLTRLDTVEGVVNELKKSGKVE